MISNTMVKNKRVKLFVLCLVIVSSTWGNALKKKTYFEEDLEGDVESVLVGKQLYPGRKIPMYKKKFDKDRRLLAYYFYNEEGIIKTKILYTYNTNGIATESLYKGNGILREKFIYNNTSQDDGTLIESSKYNVKGIQIEKFRLTREKNRTRHETIYYTINGKISGKSIAVLNSNGNVQEFCKYDANGKVKEKESYTYDSRGNSIKDIMYNSEGKIKSLFQYAYVYNSKGLVMKKTQRDAAGLVIWENSFIYDSNGYLTITKSHFPQTNETFSVRSINDSKGNWIRMEEVNGTDLYRLISYY